MLMINGFGSHRPDKAQRSLICLVVFFRRASRKIIWQFVQILGYQEPKTQGDLLLPVLDQSRVCT